MEKDRTTLSLILSIILAIIGVSFSVYGLYYLENRANEEEIALEKANERLIMSIVVKLDIPEDEFIIKEIPGHEYLKEVYTNKGVYIAEHDDDGNIIRIVKSEEKAQRNGVILYV